MPLLLIGLAIVILCICLIVTYLKKTGKAKFLDKKGFNIIVFISSLISLFISFRLSLNIWHYVEELGIPMSVVYGGQFWGYMVWLRLGLLFAICIISGLKLIKRSK